MSDVLSVVFFVAFFGPIAFLLYGALRFRQGKVKFTFKDESSDG